MNKQPVGLYLIDRPSAPLSSHRISTLDIDTDKNIVHTNYGTVKASLAYDRGLIFINVCVIDFDPNSGVPLDYLVA